METYRNGNIVITIILILALVGVGVYGYLLWQKNTELSMRVAEYETIIEDLRDDNQEKTQQLQNTLSVLQGVQTNFERVMEQRSQLQQDLDDEQARISALADQIDSISNTVGDINKLTTTDKELLQKYSKVYFLNEHYLPQDLVLIEDKYVYDDDDRYWFHKNAYPFLGWMMDAAYASGIQMNITSAYRSFYAQATLKDSYMVTYGSGANTFSADQGYSEHQLGTTVDFTTNDLNGALNEQFADTLAYGWLKQNAHKYGFVLSYPENNQYYVFEPWHWRFVGVELATHLHENNIGFYDMEQREINEYLISIFDDPNADDGSAGEE